METLKNKISKYMASISKNVLIDKLGDVVNKYNTARIQRFKEVSKTDWLKSFPL